VRHIDALREAVRRTCRERPFHIDAWVVPPEHMHRIITLPAGEDDFSNRIEAMRNRFVSALAATSRPCRARVARGERGIWQRVRRNEPDRAYASVIGMSAQASDVRGCVKSQCPVGGLSPLDSVANSARQMEYQCGV
jgi:hypothetical protein